MLSLFQPGLFYGSVDNWDIRTTRISIVMAPHDSSEQVVRPSELIQGERMICCL